MNFERARAFCAALPAATQDIKWGADLCFCVGGRMFAVTCLKGGKAEGFSFKVDDHRFLEMTDRPGIVPAPYLARAKWVLVREAAALSDAEARELLARSHALIAAKLTRAQRTALGVDAPTKEAKHEQPLRRPRNARPRAARA